MTSYKILNDILSFGRRLREPGHSASSGAILAVIIVAIILLIALGITLLIYFGRKKK